MTIFPCHAFELGKKIRHYQCPLYLCVSVCVCVCVLLRFFSCQASHSTGFNQRFLFCQARPSTVHMLNHVFVVGTCPQDAQNPAREAEAVEFLSPHSCRCLWSCFAHSDESWKRKKNPYPDFFFWHSPCIHVSFLYIFTSSVSMPSSCCSNARLFQASRGKPRQLYEKTQTASKWWDGLLPDCPTTRFACIFCAIIVQDRSKHL